MANVLIVDDDRAVCDALESAAASLQHKAVSAFTLKEAMKMLSTGDFDVVLLDVRLPDGNGIKAIPGIRSAPSSPEVVIITGEGDPDGAELAVKSGAWDYLEKPLSLHGVSLCLLRSFQYREGRKGGRPSAVLNREGIVGDSPEMRRCFDFVGRAASTDASVLISGETGTGKELFASAIHKNSARSHRGFVVVDCAALPATLVESVLFGHAKGAFTGADKAHEGLILQASGGTLFLDEVGELPVSVQKAFLRVLQEKRFRPVGSTKEAKSDFRLISATNRDLEQMARSGEFREDLLYRIRTMTLHLPPLRERTRDIRELAMFYMTRFCDGYGLGTKGFSPEFIESLCLYHWPGNVRELVSTMENVLAAAGDEPVVFPKHLPTYIRVALARGSLRNGESPKGQSPPEGAKPALGPFKDWREKALAGAEREYLLNLMGHAGWGVKEACRLSKLSRPRLYALLKKHDIKTRA